MKKSNIFIATVCLIFMLGTITAFAGTLMTYDGTGIWSKLSVGTFSINKDNSTIYVDHKTTYCPIPNGIFHIDAVRQNFIGMYTITEGEKTYVGKGSCTLKFTDLPKGVYKLNFYRDETYSAGTWNIEGTVRN